MQQVWLTLWHCICSHNRTNKGKRKDLEQWVMRIRSWQIRSLLQRIMKKAGINRVHYPLGLRAPFKVQNFIILFWIELWNPTGYNLWGFITSLPSWSVIIPTPQGAAGPQWAPTVSSARNWRCRAELEWIPGPTGKGCSSRPHVRQVRAH